MRIGFLVNKPDLQVGFWSATRREIRSSRLPFAPWSSA